MTSLTPCLRSSFLVSRMLSRTSQTGADALKSFWPPTRPEVGNWFDQVKFQEMYFCDVTTTEEKCNGKAIVTIPLPLHFSPTISNHHITGPVVRLCAIAPSPSRGPRRKRKGIPRVECAIHSLFGACRELSAGTGKGNPAPLPRRFHRVNLPYRGDERASGHGSVVE